MADEANSKTQVATLAMAGTVAVVLLFLTGPLQYLPNAVLSAVVFVIGVKLIDIARMHDIFRLRRDEFWIAALTAAVVVAVGVEQGILVAIGLSLLGHVHRHYHPHDSVITRDEQGTPIENAPGPGSHTEAGLVVYRFGVGLFYANAARLTTEALALVDVPDPPRWFVLLADGIDDIDYTGGKTLVELAEQLAQRHIVFAVATALNDVLPELDRFGLIEAIGHDHIYPSLDDAITAFHNS
jgi:MFS superfamily sulfate permease-like transporter